jgi:hypothetical protein
MLSYGIDFEDANFNEIVKKKLLENPEDLSLVGISVSMPLLGNFNIVQCRSLYSTYKDQIPSGVFYAEGLRGIWHLKSLSHNEDMWVKYGLLQHSNQRQIFIYFEGLLPPALSSQSWKPYVSQGPSINSGTVKILLPVIRIWKNRLVFTFSSIIGLFNPFQSKDESEDKKSVIIPSKDLNDYIDWQLAVFPLPSDYFIKDLRRSIHPIDSAKFVQSNVKTPVSLCGWQVEVSLLGKMLTYFVDDLFNTSISQAFS